MPRRNYRIAGRGHSHHQVFTEQVYEKKDRRYTGKKFNLNKDPMEFDGIKVENYWVLDMSHAYPEYIYRCPGYHFLTPKVKTGPLKVSSVLARIILFVYNQTLYGHYHRDLILDNFRSVDPEDIIDRKNAIFAQATGPVPEDSPVLFFSYEKCKGLRYRYSVGPMTIYTNIPHRGVKIVWPNSFVHREVNFEGKTVPVLDVVFITDPFLAFNLMIDPPQVFTPGERSEWRQAYDNIMAYISRTVKNDAARAALQERWNKFMHSIHGNTTNWNKYMHSIHGNIITDEQHRAYHNGRCPYHGMDLKRCIPVSVDAASELDSLRIHGGAIPPEADCADFLQRHTYLRYEMLPMVMTMLDMYDVLDDTLMTSGQRKWMTEHGYPNHDQDQIPAFLQQCLADRAPTDLKSPLALKSDLKPTAKKPAVQAKEVHDTIAAGGNVTKNPEYHHLMEIIRLAAPRILERQYDEEERTKYIRRLLAGAIDVDLLPVDEHLRNELKAQIKAYNDRIEAEKREREASLDPTIISSEVFVCDYDQSGLVGKLWSSGKAYQATYLLHEVYSVTVTGDDRAATDTHLKLLNPNKARYCKVSARYVQFLASENLIVRWIFWLLYWLGLRTAWYTREETTRDFIISQDLLDESVKRSSSKGTDFKAASADLKTASRSFVFPDHDRVSIISNTYEIFIGKMRLNDSRFLDVETIDSYLGWSVMDLNLNAYQLRNLMSAEFGSSVSTLKILIAVSLLSWPIVFSLIFDEWSSLAQIILTEASWRQVYDTAWDMFLDSSILILLVLYEIMFVVFASVTYLQLTDTKICRLLPGCLDLITLLLAVTNYKKSMTNILVILVPFLTTLTHSVSMYSPSKNSTRTSSMLEASILVRISLNVCISLLLIGLKKLFTSYLSSSNMYLHINDMTSFTNVLGSSMSITKQISQVLKLILQDSFTILLNWKFFVICAAILLTIWVLIYLQNLDLIPYSVPSQARINVISRVVILMLLLGVCQAKCLHPLAMDSLTIYSTPLSSNETVFMSIPVSWKEMMDYSDSETTMNPSYLPRRCMNHWDLSSNSSSTGSLESLVSAVLCIQRPLNRSYVTLGSCYQSLFGTLAYSSPHVNDNLTLSNPSYSQHYANVLDALWSLQLSCGLPAIWENFYHHQILSSSTSMLEILMMQRWQAVLNYLGLDIDWTIYQDGTSSVEVFHMLSHESVLSLRSVNTSLILQEMNITAFSELIPSNSRLLKVATYYAAHMSRVYNFFGRTAQSLKSHTKGMSSINPKFRITSHTGLYQKTKRAATSALHANATRLANSILSLVSNGTRGLAHLPMSMYNMSIEAMVVDLNTIFSAHKELTDWYHDYTDALIYHGSYESFIIGCLIQRHVLELHLEFTASSVSFLNHVEGFINMDSNFTLSINWRRWERTRELFFQPVADHLVAWWYN